MANGDPTVRDVPESWFKFLKEISIIIAAVTGLITTALGAVTTIITALNNSHANAIKKDVNQGLQNQEANSAKLDQTVKAAQDAKVEASAAKIEAAATKDVAKSQSDKISKKIDDVKEAVRPK